jgi:hypothetical protein
MRRAKVVGASCGVYVGAESGEGADESLEGLKVERYNVGKRREETERFIAQRTRDGGEILRYAQNDTRATFSAAW